MSYARKFSSVIIKKGTPTAELSLKILECEGDNIEMIYNNANILNNYEENCKKYGSLDDAFEAKANELAKTKLAKAEELLKAKDREYIKDMVEDFGKDLDYIKSKLLNKDTCSLTESEIEAHYNSLQKND